MIWSVFFSLFFLEVQQSRVEYFDILTELNFSGPNCFIVKIGHFLKIIWNILKGTRERVWVFFTLTAYYCPHAEVVFTEE